MNENTIFISVNEYRELIAKAERIKAVERMYASDNYFNDATIKTILGIDEVKESENETV